MEKRRGHPTPPCGERSSLGEGKGVSDTDPGVAGESPPSSPGRRPGEPLAAAGRSVQVCAASPSRQQVTHRGGAGQGRALGGEEAAPPARAPQRRPREGHSVTRRGEPRPADPAACCGLPAPPRRGGRAGPAAGEAGGRPGRPPPHAPVGPQRPKRSGRGRGWSPGGAGGERPGTLTWRGGGTAAWIPAGEATRSAAAARRTHTHPAALRPRFRRRRHAPSGAEGVGRHRPSRLPIGPAGAAGSRFLWRRGGLSRFRAPARPPWRSRGHGLRPYPSRLGRARPRRPWPGGGSERDGAEELAGPARCVNTPRAPQGLAALSHPGTLQALCLV